MMRFSAVRMIVGIGIVAMLSIATTSADACTRRPEVTRDPGDPPSFPYHPPGTYGELDRTVTLDCLSYVGSVERGGREHVLIKDERGKVHVLTVGGWMGWSRSIIVKIDAEYIYLRQLVNMIEAPYADGRDLSNATAEEVARHYEHVGREKTIKFPKYPARY